MYVCMYLSQASQRLDYSPLEYVHWIQGAIGHSNVYWEFDLSKRSNGQMERPMDISTVFAFGELFIMLYDMLASSTACWLKARVLAIGKWIYWTRRSNGSIGHSNVHWTCDSSSRSNGRMQCPMNKSNIRDQICD